MKERSGRVVRAGARAARLVATTIAVAVLGAAGGCSSQTPVLPGTTFKVDLLETPNGVDKIDLLLVVDNSPGMAAKQAILALALPELITGLVNPKCLDDSTNLPVANQPAGPTDACPTGSTRDFAPVLDMHVGVLSSSLGSFGASACAPTDAHPCDAGISDNDFGRLIERTDPCGMAPVATYQNLGFLAWDPLGALMPPGEAAIGDPGATPPVPGLTTSLHDIVVGDGQLGCDFESQNEAWYRFLVDPTPYQGIALVDDTVQTTGIDMTLLAQRADFLRPDSLLAIVNVTDETDTSLKEYGPYPLFAQTNLHLPLPRSACAAKGPNDPCCASCGESTPQGCPIDPQCMGGAATYTDATENVALRAFGLISHKARYGIDFFYPPSRYVQALTSPEVLDLNDKPVPNPLYSVLDPSKDSGSIRNASMVFYAAVVGVPWQLIARQDKDGTPDLIDGVSTLAPTDPTQRGGFKSSAELSLLDAKGDSFWDDISGDPENYVAAKSPFMVESTTPRAGTDNVTGASISPVSTPNGGGAMVGGALVNDHERTLPTPAGDIEYACVFPMLAAIDCSVPGAICDCPPLIAPQTTTDNPLCAPNPADGDNPTLQVKAKAYPGIKHLAIAKGMGTQGIVASICAKQLTDPTADDFGYRPAVKAILAGLTPWFRTPCRPIALTPGTTGDVPCFVLEATAVPAAMESACNACTTPGRQPVSTSNPDLAPAVQTALQSPLAQSEQWNCFCEIPQTTGATGTNPGLEDCQTAAHPTANGWCYVDPATAPAADVAAEEARLSRCPMGEQHEVRFVGNGAPTAGATVFIACATP